MKNAYQALLLLQPEGHACRILQMESKYSWNVVMMPEAADRLSGH
jgi:hypothetical protein